MVETQENLNGAGEHKKGSGPHSAWLWILALLLMAGIAIYQRRTGPTMPLKGTVTIAGLAHPYKFLRSENTTEDARVALPDHGIGMSCFLVYRRYNSDDEAARLPFRAEELDGRKVLAAYVPKQPAAGKVEYHVEVLSQEGTKRIPEQGEIIIRFKDPVAASLLIPHIACMFLAMLVGLRAGLAALFDSSHIRSMALFTLCALTLGGMILGPFVQKAAFGQYWTGWPKGYDLTDNKTLIMFLVWLGACAILYLRTPSRTLHRWVVGLAALVMATVYLIPHSLRGSELDYRTKPAQHGAQGR